MAVFRHAEGFGVAAEFEDGHAIGADCGGEAVAGGKQVFLGVDNVLVGGFAKVELGTGGFEAKVVFFDVSGLDVAEFGLLQDPAGGATDVGANRFGSDFVVALRFAEGNERSAVGVALFLASIHAQGEQTAPGSALGVVADGI